MFVPDGGLMTLYAVSALFGLFQGGIVPAYALVVREYFTPREAGARVGTVLMATLFGMALGGWMSGAIFDLTGSYRAAFVNGIALEPAQRERRRLPALPGAAPVAPAALGRRLNRRHVRYRASPCAQRA